MVPVDAWAIRPIRAMRVTVRRPTLLVRVVISIKKIVDVARRVVKRVVLGTPKSIRRILKPWAQGPP